MSDIGASSTGFYSGTDGGAQMKMPSRKRDARGNIRGAKEQCYRFIIFGILDNDIIQVMSRDEITQLLESIDPDPFDSGSKEQPKIKSGSQDKDKPEEEPLPDWEIELELKLERELEFELQAQLEPDEEPKGFEMPFPSDIADMYDDEFIDFLVDATKYLPRSVRRRLLKLTAEELDSNSFDFLGKLVRKMTIDNLADGITVIKRDPKEANKNKGQANKNQNGKSPFYPNTRRS
ncbi:hypothetical protein KR018_007044 [Drosophila ironensis]|nr:hypothetical protein KR018_007044 [Drosophila ironensis]